jgi:hypothetical protein
VNREALLALLDRSKNASILLTIAGVTRALTWPNLGRQ